MPFLVIFFSLIICPQVYAEDEAAYFGSESYSWNYEETNPIGIYAYSSETIASVEITVTYDQEMLEYVDGGTLVEEGEVQITADTIESNEFKRLLYFTPVCSGSTEITISSTVITDIYGNTTTADPVSVTVQINISADAVPEALTINGTEITGFDSGTSEYSVDITDVDPVLEIECTPDTLEIEVSDTALEAGENTVYIYVTGTDGGRARYILTVNYTEAETAGAAETETETEIETETEAETEAAQGFVSKVIDKIKRHAEYVFLLFIGILFLFTLILDINKSGREQENDDPESTVVEVVPLDLSLLDLDDEDDGKDTIIDVSHVTMEFKRDVDESTSLKELIIRFIKGQRQIVSFKALDDVSFTVKQGEIIGIVGTNGSGKSTMLKIISGALSPTKGKVTVDRSKIQLLTLGTGFDHELTGRENVYLNGSIIGFTKQFIDEHYDSIVEFAELEGFMDEKVRNYSSGMISRLGFAIATAGDAPEILILDEVLSVGDMFFRQKSEKRIRELIHSGSTVIIVSHSTNVIKKNCTKVIWIEKSHLRMIGSPDEVCKAYENMNADQSNG